MADITMCDGQDANKVCPMREFCYRYTATPNEYRQSVYRPSIPLKTSQDGTSYCLSYWINEESRHDKNARAFLKISISNGEC